MENFEGNKFNSPNQDQPDEETVKLVNQILSDAIKNNATAIHIESGEASFRVRFRINDNLKEEMQPPENLKRSVIERIKIMSCLDITEKRLPQDGRMIIKYGNNQEAVFAVNILPASQGESIVMKLLKTSTIQLNLANLGFEQKQLKMFREALNHPQGMVLVAGPTGAGKTTTVYSALVELEQESKKIITVENPIIFSLPGINQNEVNCEIGLNHAAILRSSLRQDGDIIMINDMIDFETADIAMKASLNGHMVISKLWTNDAPGTLYRLQNMGIEPLLITRTVLLIQAQRLIRKLCPECKIKVAPGKNLLEKLGIEEKADSDIFEIKGCDSCNNTGYDGWTMVCETMPFTDDLKESFISGVKYPELRNKAIQSGMLTLRQSAINRFKAGETSVDEVLRVTPPLE